MKRIRLNENNLKKIIFNSVTKVLKEMSGEDNADDSMDYEEMTFDELCDKMRDKSKENTPDDYAKMMTDFGNDKDHDYDSNPGITTYFNNDDKFEPELNMDYERSFPMHGRKDKDETEETEIAGLDECIRRNVRKVIMKETKRSRKRLF